MRSARRAGLSLFVGLSCALFSCKKDPPPPPAPVVAVPQEEPAVPAPEGLTVEAVIRSPDAIVQSFRTLSPILPDKAAPVLADMLHVTRETTDEIEGQKPSFFVLVRRGNESYFVLAIPVKDASKVLSALSKQGLSRTEDPAQQLSIFEAGIESKGPRSQVLGVRRGFFLAASSTAALKELTPFVTRTMPTRALPKEDVAVTVPQSALRGPVRDGLNAMIAARGDQKKLAAAKAKAGIAVPSGAPAASVYDAFGDYLARQNERVVGWLGDAGDAHLTITTVNGSIAIRGDVLAPAESSLAKQMATWPLGDATAILDLPAGAVLAFSGRASEAARTESSKDLGEMLASAFPDDVGPAERAKIEGFLTAWDKARGEVTSGAFLYEGPTKLGIAARLGARDPHALAKLMKEAFTSIFAIKGVTAGLAKEGVAPPTITTEKIGGVDAWILSVKLPRAKGEKPKPGEPETAEIVWGAHGPDVAFVAGVGGRTLFLELLDAKGSKSLRAFPGIEGHLKSLGASLAGLLIALPTRALPIASGQVVSKPAAPEDPISISMGRSDKGPWANIDVSRGAVELAGKFAMQSLLAPK